MTTSMPYMPDEARARMPCSALQPLPPYLREDFAQSLDRTRTPELVVPEVKGKKVDPRRLGCLTYQYEDTGETVTVPNVWYNQTVQMRLDWWRFEAQRLEVKVTTAKQELEQALSCTAPFYKDQRIDKARLHLRWQLEELERTYATVLKVLADVEAGTRFL